MCLSLFYFVVSILFWFKFPVLFSGCKNTNFFRLGGKKAFSWSGATVSNSGENSYGAGEPRLVPECY